MAKTDTRQRMLLSAVDLLREEGAAGVTIDAVLAASGAPRGSVYHHFPGGRRQIVQEAAEFASSHMEKMLRSDGESDPTMFAARFVEMWRETLVASNFRSGCPIVGLLGDRRAGAEKSRSTAASAFSRWEDALAASLTRSGWPDQEARDRAVLLIATIEGAVLMCQAEGSVRPLDRITDSVVAAVQPPAG